MSFLSDILILCIVQLMFTIKCVVSYEQQQNTSFSLQIFGKCFSHSDIVDCLRNQMVSTIDTAIQDNGTWHLNDFVALEPNPNFKLTPDDEMKSREEDSMLTKVNELLRSRRLEIKSDLVPMVDEGKSI